MTPNNTDRLFTLGATLFMLIFSAAYLVLGR